MSQPDRRPKLTYLETPIPAFAKPTGTGVPKSADDVAAALKSKIGADVVVKVTKEFQGDHTITIKSEKNLEVLKFLRDDERFLCQELRVVSAVDYLPPAEGDNLKYLGEARLEVVYVLYSFVHKHQIILKCELPREGGKIATASGLWRCANWYERECYDMVGMIFTGHPDHTRILLPNDWVGHPLRRDYVFPEDYNGMKVPL
jgi:NADH-quinone oxidoreductase subunit C